MKRHLRELSLYSILNLTVQETVQDSNENSLKRMYATWVVSDPVVIDQSM